MSQEGQGTPSAPDAVSKSGYGEAVPVSSLELAKRASNGLQQEGQEQSVGGATSVHSNDSATQTVTDYGYGEAVPTSALAKLARRASNGIGFGLQHSAPEPVSYTHLTLPTIYTV